MKTINSRNISLEEVVHLFKYRRERNYIFTDLLSLETLSELEKQEIEQIRKDFENYFARGLISEGQIKFLGIAPLLRLAGFYRSPIKITLEENIAEIILEDEDEETKIMGRIDILAVTNIENFNNSTPFWILILEAKNSDIAPSAGLAQLLTYAFKSLQTQSSVWGLLTNGEYYQFVYIRSNDSPAYHIMPSLNFLEIEPAQKILQVLQAILHSLL